MKTLLRVFPAPTFNGAVAGLVFLLVTGIGSLMAVEAQENAFQVSERVHKKLPQRTVDPGHRDIVSRVLKAANRVEGTRPASAPEGAAPHVLFAHPLRKGISNPRPGFYGISAYVDQDPDTPDMLLDYNCGDRTYDLDDGYNHDGVDYFNWPFSWLTMQQDGSIAVAAADGIIVDMHDGEPDMSCDLPESSEANYIALQHQDGSFTLYAHFKRNTMTAREVGDTVEKGDYLGVVGSSGFSNGPHLHFGVFDSMGETIEPHAGACNMLNDDSWWENQENYYLRSVNFIATHSDVPEFPDCPSVEKPHLQNVFSIGDIAWFSAFYPDYLADEPATWTITDPNGLQVANVTDELDEEYGEYVVGYFSAIGFNIPGGSASGAYTFRVTYGSVVREHTFYVDASPPTPSVPTVFNNAYNGLWYDPELDGEGYNFVTADAGTVVYFYGSDASGKRLWLISDLIPGNFGVGVDIEVTMFESTGGTYESPVPSARGLSVWGTLRIEFSECDAAVATLIGADGTKVSQLVKLAGAAGTICTAGDIKPDSPWSGLWYDTSDEGEGYNFIVAPNGAILYYYGFKSSGDRLWLISDLIPGELEVGVPVEIALFEATQGNFANPAPSSMLVQWGTATITLDDCGHITIVLSGIDGNKTSQTIRLAGVIGLECED